MRWPWAQPEQRSETTDNYTDRVVSAILARARSGTDTGALAAQESAVGFYSRALSSATVTPENSPLTMALTPSFLALAGRRLATKGNFVALIEVAGGSVRFIPATSYDVSGEADPSTWVYRIDLGGPSRQKTIRTEAAGVVHFRVNADLSWRGRGALEVASAAGRLSAAVEKSLELEQLFPPTTIVHTSRQGEQVSDFAADLRRGGLLVENIDESDPSAGSNPPHNIGPKPDENEVTLRGEAAKSIMAAHGLSPSLWESGSDGTAQRESFRRAFTTCLNPWAMMISEELTAKLETPVTLTLDEIRAADAQGQSRALSSRATALKHLVEAGVGLPVALELAGFGDV